MNLANFANYVYRRTKQGSSAWGTSGADLVIALNAARSVYLDMIRDKTDNYYPTAWTTTELSTGTATPEIDALFHELIPLRVTYQYWLTNEKTTADAIYKEELYPMEQRFQAFYAARQYRIVTVTIASPGVFTRKFHGLNSGNRVIFSTSGALPTGLTAFTWYYVISQGLGDETFQVAATKDGTAINTTGSQSGTHWFATDTQPRARRTVESNK